MDFKKMQLNYFTDYALRILMLLSQTHKKQMTSRDLAEFYDISLNHVVKIVHRLGQLGYIENTKGRGGGVRLACAPKDIQLGLLCQQLESHCLVECFSDEKKCVIFSKCLFKNVLKEALDAFIQTLSRYTLEDLVDRQKNGDF